MCILVMQVVERYCIKLGIIIIKQTLYNACDFELLPYDVLAQAKLIMSDIAQPLSTNSDPATYQNLLRLCVPFGVQDIKQVQHQLHQIKKSVDDYIEGLRVGLNLAIAIALHNIPEVLLLHFRFILQHK
nr:hypothetical protein [Tanacetum cinerariifolium]